MKKKILIIEDEKFIADMYKLKLEKAGYQASIALDGAEGVEMAEKELPDLILLDILMPKLNGYEVLRELKNNNKTKNIKTVFLTNLSDEYKQEKDPAKNESKLMKVDITPQGLVAYVNNILK